MEARAKCFEFFNRPKATTVSSPVEAPRRSTENDDLKAIYDTSTQGPLGDNPNLTRSERIEIARKMAFVMFNRPQASTSTVSSTPTVHVDMMRAEPGDGRVGPGVGGHMLPPYCRT